MTMITMLWLLAAVAGTGVLVALDISRSGRQAWDDALRDLTAGPEESW